MFEQNVKATSGPFAGYYLWRQSGELVARRARRRRQRNYQLRENLAVDDLAALQLSSLTLDGDDQLYVVGASLNAATLSGEPGGSLVAGFLTISRSR